MLPQGTFAPDDPLMGDGPIAGVASQPSSERPDSLVAARRSKALASQAQVSEKLAVPGDEDWFRFTATENARVLARLGDLPSDHSLTVYDARGREVGSSDRPGTDFELVHWNARPGDYFARVALAPGEEATGRGRTPEYRFRFRQLPAGVVKESWNAPSVDGGKAVRVVVDLVNTTSSWMRLTGVFVDQLDATGKVVRRDPFALPVEVMKPYGGLALTSAPVVIDSRWAGWRIVPAAEQAGPPRVVPRLRLVPDRRSAADDDRIYSGTVRNDGPAAVDGTSALITHREYDGLGLITAAGWAKVPAVAAGGTAPYRVALGDPVGQPRVEIDVVAPIR